MRCSRQRAIVLVDKIAETARDLVGCDERWLIALRVFGLTAQPEFEPLQAFGDLGLKPLELPRIFVHAVVVKLPHRAKDFVEVSGVDAVGLQLVAQPLRFAGPVAGLVAVIADFLRSVNALTPAAPVVAAVRRAAIGAIAERAVTVIAILISALTALTPPCWPC